MHNKVVFRAAAGLVDAGLITLRLIFAVWAPRPANNEIEGGSEDVGDVLDSDCENIPGEDLTLAGFSFGSRTATEVGTDDDRVGRLISVGTPVDKYGDYRFSYRTKPILFVHGDKDEFGSLELSEAGRSSRKKTQT